MEHTKLHAFDTQAFYNSLTTTEIGRRIWVFDTLDSTNGFIKSLDPEATPPGLICVALDQKSGRGQFSRHWKAVRGDSLTFTICIKPRYADRLQLLLQTATLSVVETLHHFLESAGVTDHPQYYLKWPNDIMIGDQKIGGILAESTFIGDKLERFMLGVGFNVNNDCFPDEINSIAVSLYQITGRKTPPEEVLACICNCFEKNLKLWNASDPEMIKKINHLYLGFGKWNYMSVNGHKKEGRFKFLGLDSDGFPLFLDEQDTIKRVTHQHIRFFPL